MIKSTVATLILGACASLAYASHTVTWTAVFSNIQPNHKGISMQFCKLHTPTVMVTTISQITSKKGVKALNNIWVKYLSYVTHKKNGLYFNIVNAQISGKTDGKKWTTPMKLYEQTLSPTGVTNTVWATKYCKGKFVGTATVTNKP